MRIASSHAPFSSVCRKCSSCSVQLSKEYTRSSNGAAASGPKPHSKPVSVEGLPEGAGSVVGHDRPCPNQSAYHTSHRFSGLRGRLHCNRPEAQRGVCWGRDPQCVVLRSLPNMEPQHVNTKQWGTRETCSKAYFSSANSITCSQSNHVVSIDDDRDMSRRTASTPRCHQTHRTTGGVHLWRY